ncbi:transposon Tf2-6 polyprotein [Trichonephila clavipes]|nr:transposon Tf2-6 polyprotein [Trichonephila clavipes]
MYRNVVRYVTHCRECQRRKSVPQRPPDVLVPIPPAIAPFHRIGIDGRFKVCSWKQMDNSLHGLLNTICNNKALPTAEVDEIAKFLLEEIKSNYHRSWSCLSIQTFSRRLV